MTSHDPEFERRLRRALQRVDPPSGFAERVLAAIARGEAPRDVTAPSRPRRFALPRPPLRRRAWMPAAAAAALVVLAGAHWAWHRHTEIVRAREAREQVVEALRISSETLNAALAAAVERARAG